MYDKMELEKESILLDHEIESNDDYFVELEMDMSKHEEIRYLKMQRLQLQNSNIDKLKQEEMELQSNIDERVHALNIMKE